MSLTDPLRSAVKDSLSVAVRQGKSEEQPLEPGLYIVSTPIGNLEDITIRALGVLAFADMLYAEDTRMTRVLLSSHGIKRGLQSYHDHNGERVRPEILRHLQAGLSVALVCDAGTPCVSDPGFALVREAHAAGNKLIPIPGASAVLAALAVSGLPSDRFLFAGFPPRRRGARRQLFTELAQLRATLIFFEAGPRLASSLADMAEIFGEREAVLGREMTKRFEEIIKMPLSQLALHVASVPMRGEMTLLLAPESKHSRKSSQSQLEQLIQKTDKSLPLKEQAGLIAAMSGRSRREAYAGLMAARRRRRYRLGIWAEYAACALLLVKGYAICALRAKTGAGEIDIIAQKGRLLAFVEVKSRHSTDAALEAVTIKAQQRITHAAEIWLAKHRRFSDYEQRFDIIAMRGMIPTRHICDAFRPEAQRSQQ